MPMKGFQGIEPLRRLWHRCGTGTRTALILCLFGFAVQALVRRAPILVLYATADGTAHALPDPLTLLLAIHGRALAHGFFWTPVTYMFLHGSWSHLLLNAVGLLVMGNAVETLLGARRFWTVFLVSGIAGGIGWTLVQGLASEVPCVGASAGVLGLIGGYAALRPRDRFLLIFPFPVSLSARTLALWLAIANVIDLAFGRGQIAYMAHLSGLVAGVLHGISLRHAGRGFPRKWFRTPGARLRPEPRTLDELLAKIHREGIRSLSEGERRILEDSARRGLEGRQGLDD